MPTVPLPPAPDKGPARYVLTCVRLVCDVFLSVELVGGYPSAVAAALGMAAHAVQAGVGWPRGEGDGDKTDDSAAGTRYRTPVGDRGGRHVYHLVAVPDGG